MSKLAEEARDPLGMFRLPSVPDLNGEVFILDFEDGGNMTMALGTDTARFSASGLPWPDEGEGPLDVVKIRDDIYFVDIDTEKPAKDGMTVILLKAVGRALAVHQRRVAPDHLWERGPDCRQTFLSGVIRGAKHTGEAPEKTKDLLGAREFLLMGPENVYEHIYISHELMVVNHIHTNLARGKAEVQPATYYKLADHLYLVGVREMDNGTGLLQVLDYDAMRMTGRAHHAVDRWKSVSRRLGGQLVVVNGRLTYPKGLEPTGFLPDPE